MPAKFKEPKIVNYIKVNRLEWAWHLVRTNNNRTLKKVFNTKPDGVRRDERPKLRWEYGVDQDMRILEVKNWKNSMEWPTDATMCSEFIFSASPLYMFRAVHTAIIRSTGLTVSTVIGTIIAVIDRIEIKYVHH